MEEGNNNNYYEPLLVLGTFTLSVGHIIIIILEPQMRDMGDQSFLPINYLNWPFYYWEWGWVLRM